MKDFYERLKELRKEQNVTQDELTQALGLKKSAIINIENKGTAPTLDLIIKLADYFGISIDELVGKTDKKDGFSFIDSIFSRPLNETLKLNENIPMWFRFKLPFESNENDQTYRGMGEIELYNPLDYKEENQRIYLDFLNLCNVYINKDYLKFFELYGYLGRFLCDRSNDENLVDGLVLESPISGSAYQTSHYDGLHYIKQEPLSVSNFYSIDICKLIDLNLSTFDSQHSLSLYSINDGYFETIDLLNKYWIDLANTIGNYVRGDKAQAYGIINHNLMDIIFLRLYKGENRYTTFVYKSLISLMFLELLHDYENNIIPEVCSICHNDFTIAKEDNVPICKKCLNNRR